MWIFTILKPYFHHKIARRIQIQLDRRVPMTVKFRPIKLKVNSRLKITKLFQFQNAVFHTVFNGCCSLLVVYAMHDGQDLKHPLPFIHSISNSTIDHLIYPMN